MQCFNNELIQKYAAFAMEKQLSFADIVGSKNWNVDINKGEISFDDEFVFPMQILGTFSHSSETWLWGWANTQSGIPEKLLEQSKLLQEYGHSHNIDFLTQEQFEIERDDMHRIGLLALGMFNADGYYLGNYGAGTMCLTISSDEIRKKFSNSHHSIFSVFSGLISQYEINHKDAFVNYLTQKEYQIEKNGTEIIGTKGKDIVKALFDTLDRLETLTNIE
ncbi:MAG: hypothetical protein LBV20_07910 [Treponema sp.]|jgi:hypothetical protein|nr:hypothetical protein [Treponema sp.]